VYHGTPVVGDCHDWPKPRNALLRSLCDVCCCSQSTQALIPPQHQLVHTTGSASSASVEVLSSSPTSSHTDYMPATSSAGPSVGSIRQVAVQPTQQTTATTVAFGPSLSSREEPPLLAAESTQVIGLSLAYVTVSTHNYKCLVLCFTSTSFKVDFSSSGIRKYHSKVILL
jgi:hypothetical protein